MTTARSIRIIVSAAALSALAFTLAGCTAGPPPPSPVASPVPSTAISPVPSTDASTVPSSVPTPVASPVPSPDATGVLLTVETRGGKCVGGPCGMTVIVERDGRVHLAAKPPNDLGVVSPDLIAALDAEIQTTDWAELFSHRFTGECPTAYDGQEVVFEFAAPTGVQRVATCEVDVDFGSPLFVAVSAAIGPFVSLPIF